MEERVLAEETGGPVLAVQDGAQAGEGTGDGRSLGIDQAFGQLVPVVVAPGSGDALPDLVGEPALQVRQPGGHTLLTLLGPAGVGRTRTRRLGCLGRLRRAGRRLDEALAPLVEPLGHPVGRLLGGGDSAGRPQEQQAESVFAGKLPAWATASVGGLGQVDARPVGR
jgi:hypothetical protein